MTTDLDTLLIARYVKTDEESGGPRWMGRPPVLTDSELVCIAVAQAMLGFTSEAHRPRYARKHLTGMFPYLPKQSGDNKRLRAASGLVKQVIPMLAKSNDFWLLICDKGSAGNDFETLQGEYGITMLHPSRKDEKTRYSEPTLKKARQPIESVNDTLKGQPDLENHRDRLLEGIPIRIAQRVLATAAAIWHNNATNAPITRSLITYDH